MRAAVRGAIVVVAVAIAWAFAASVLRHTRPMALPLDDSYVYLTYARQIGRGSGYSADAASALWPVVLAPLWTLGARGPALVWAAFALSAALYAATVLGVHRVVERIAGGAAAALAAIMVLAIAPFARAALSATEVAVVSALLVTAIRWLLDAPAFAAPPRKLVACLAALALARPVATLLVAVITGAAAIHRLRRHDLRAAAWWLAPLAAPAAWLVLHRAGAGHWLPSAIAHSDASIPGLDGADRIAALWMQIGRMLRGVLWGAAGPLGWPQAIAVLWLAGSVRVVLWARRERCLLAAAVIVAAPLAVALAAAASLDPWSADGDRYVAPALPMLVIAAGCAFAPLGHRPRLGRVLTAIAGLFTAAFAVDGARRGVTDVRVFAQGAMDSNAQGVAIGDYIRRKLPGARVMVRDAGAIAYHSDAVIDDLRGIVVADRSGIALAASHGPGAVFELLERMAPERRPTHFAGSPAWLGTGELLGDVVLSTSLRRALEPSQRLTDAGVQLIAMSWDHVGTGERPLNDHAGWSIVDRIDVADLTSEAEHRWSAALGPPGAGDPAARWSVVGREVGAHGLVLDGGRTIRGGSERFTIAADPARPARLVIRSGGARTYRYHEPIDRPVPLRLLDAAGRELARATLPPAAPDGAFIEVAFALPAGAPAALHIAASAPYRVFHWFVLQPE